MHVTIRPPGEEHEIVLDSPEAREFRVSEDSKSRSRTSVGVVVAAVVVFVVVVISR